MAFERLRTRVGDELLLFNGQSPDSVTLTYPARFGPPEEALLRKKLHNKPDSSMFD